MRFTPLLFLFGCTTSNPALGLSDDSLDSSGVACDTGSDDTAAVQAAITAGTRLPPGVYNVDTPALVSGHRKSSMLTGGTLLGSGDALTTIRFRGDGGAQFWVGLTLTTGSDVHDIKLDSSCLVNCYSTSDCTKSFEQTHLIRMNAATDNVTIADATLVHPVGGDCVNVTGAAALDSTGHLIAPYVPNHNLTIDHVTGVRCKRGFVQVSRGLDGLTIRNSTSLDAGFDIGSEGAGFKYSIDGSYIRTLTNVLVTHNSFSSPRASGYLLQLEWAQNIALDHNTGTRPLLSFMSDHVASSYNRWANTGSVVVPVLNFGDEAHDVSSTSDVLTQTQPTDVIRAAPLDRNRQADLGDVRIAGSRLEQAAAGDFVTLSGVTGASMTGATLVYTGPATRVPSSIVTKTSGGLAPAIAVPTTSVSETGTTRVGF